MDTASELWIDNTAKLFCFPPSVVQLWIQVERFRDQPLSTQQTRDNNDKCEIEDDYKQFFDYLAGSKQHLNLADSSNV